MSEQKLVATSLKEINPSAAAACYIGHPRLLLVDCPRQLEILQNARYISEQQASPAG